MNPRPGSPRMRLVLTCEHGGNRIPGEYARLFRGAASELSSHRGWDPGALDVGRALARHLRRPLHAVTWSRLLVESNRAPHNPRIWSDYTAGLSREERERILERYWRPHRFEVERAVQGVLDRGFRVLHVAVHSFTPRLGRVVRNADVALLYDSRRDGERALCLRWQREIEALAPELRVRRNYPYRGLDDGLPTWLRRRFPAGRYLGVELELNQALVRETGPRRLGVLVGTTLERLL